MSEWRLAETGLIGGPVQLGMPLEDVKCVLGKKYDSFRRTHDATNEILAFVAQGIHVVVDGDGTSVAGVIVFSPNSVWLADVQLLHQPISSLQETLVTRGFAFEYDDVGLWNPEVNACLIDVDGLVDGVQIGSSG